MTDKKRETEMSLAPIDEEKEISLEIDDRAATRQAIINQVNSILKEKYHTQFLERSAWKAKNPKKALDEEWDYDSIVVHHQGNSVFWECGDIYKTVNNIQNEHMTKKNFDDIGYHYIISCNGTIAEGRDIRFKGSHVLDNNNKKIGILLSGDYSERNESNLSLQELSHWSINDIRRNSDKLADYLDFAYSSSVPVAQQSSLKILISALISVFNISKLGGHREFSLLKDKRTCPGNIAMILINQLREEFILMRP